MSTGHRFLNGLFHLLHLAIIVFLVSGWAFPKTRAFHLAFIVVTLASWAVFGSCPLTEWHWRLRQAAGLKRPEGPYVPFLAAQILGRPVDTQRLDKVVITFTMLIALASLLANAAAYFGRP